MHEIYARNVSDALFQGLQSIQNFGRRINTRNGEVLEFPSPVITTYTNSRERVLFYEQRDANPFFHLMESFWMLAGRNDVEWISQFNGRINTYSDDGIRFHGAYGHRWRHWFEKDQIHQAIFRLNTYENDRRAVLGMWDPKHDLVSTNDGNDYPCNTHIYFSKRNIVGRDTLDMTVCNRSNDMIWGAYGANAVHMSILLEYMAAMTDCVVGKYYQFSNNLHVYTEVFDKVKGIIQNGERDNYLTIADDGLSYSPPYMITDKDTFNVELLEWFADETKTDYNNLYLLTTANMVRKSWQSWKQGNIQEAIEWANIIEDRAWRKACVEWLKRRRK